MKYRALSILCSKADIISLFEQIQILFLCHYDLQLSAEQQRGVRGAMHQPSRVSDAGCEEAEQRHGRVPRQHPVAEELLAPGLITQPYNLVYCCMIIFYSLISATVF
jgi:hypothetical protein